MRELQNHETTALVWISGLAAVTIVGTAFMLSPPSCVQEKAEVLDLKRVVADQAVARSEIPYGTCVNYETSRQTICRKHISLGGALYIKALRVDGEIVTPEKEGE